MNEDFLETLVGEVAASTSYRTGRDLTAIDRTMFSKRSTARSLGGDRKGANVLADIFVDCQVRFDKVKPQKLPFGC